MSEPETAQWIEHYATQGTVFYDVGACVGEFSVLAWGCKAIVFAFEPHPANFSALARGRSTSLGLSTEITALPVALSSEVQIASLGIMSGDFGSVGHTLGKHAREGKEFKGYVSVLSAPLDWVIKQFALPWPTMMKIDVDGCEERVLLGAHETLRRPELKYVMVEVNGEDSEVPGLMKRAGFRQTDSVTVASFANNCFFERVTCER